MVDSFCGVSLEEVKCGGKTSIPGGFTISSGTFDPSAFETNTRMMSPFPLGLRFLSAETLFSLIAVVLKAVFG